MTAAFAASACASAGATAASPGRVGRWSATLRAAQSAAPAPAGSILLTPIGVPGRTRVELSVTAPSLRGSRLAWGVYPGACGTAARAVIPAIDFPTVDVGTSGTGVVRTELALSLDPSATYHVSVYGPSREADAAAPVLCANLVYGVSR